MNAPLSLRFSSGQVCNQVHDDRSFSAAEATLDVLVKRRTKKRTKTLPSQLSCHGGGGP
jgi:hypothetical protein